MGAPVIRVTGELIPHPGPIVGEIDLDPPAWDWPRWGHPRRTTAERQALERMRQRRGGAWRDHYDTRTAVDVVPAGWQPATNLGVIAQALGVRFQRGALFGGGFRR